MDMYWRCFFNLRRLYWVSELPISTDVCFRSFQRRLVGSSTGTNLFTYRSHNCGELREEHVGQQVTLCGWLQYKRMDKFLVLRDCYGSTQLFASKHHRSTVSTLNFETVLRISGTVRPRPEKQRNPAMATGDIEVEVESVNVLNRCRPSLPISMTGLHESAEELRLRYRYLSLRGATLQHNLRLRAATVSRMRRFLEVQCGFIEIETPTLFRKTPGGAAEFIVPVSTEAGKFYTLPQSPQQFKQLLMVGGFDRYYQIARCYRDEGSKQDRQPEFTQVDLEMSFVDENDVMQLVEQLISESWPPELNFKKPAFPFQRMTYADAMERYGTEKPDTRFGWLLSDVSHCADCPQVNMACFVVEVDGAGPLVIPPTKVAEFREYLTTYYSSFATEFDVVACTNHQESTARLLTRTETMKVFDAMQFTIGDNRMLVVSKGANMGHVRQTLGYLRLKIADFLSENGMTVGQDSFNFVWIVDFPLFVAADNVWRSAHNPFTAPRDADVETLYRDPGAVVGRHYDLVLNGVELGGGSIRIHDSQLQRYILGNVLQEDCSAMHHLLEALDYGAPPHGGFAIGLDRYIVALVNAQSIREVIAFPKSNTGRDPMSDAPTVLAADVLNRFHVKVADDKDD